MASTETIEEVKQRIEQVIPREPLGVSQGRQGGVA